MLKEKRMKVVILAGGLPSTVIEEDEKLPKPMVEIGGRPILWHIMKQYAHYGFRDFIICAGYKSNMIKDYFMNFYIFQSDITVNLQTNDVTIHRKQTENWNVSVIDTGLHSTTGERIKKVREYIKNETFIAAYGDCVSDINIKEMLQFHLENKKTATLAVTKPTGRNEILPINENGEFISETPSPMQHNSWVSTCNMILEPDIYEYLGQDNELLDKNMMYTLIKNQNVQAYKHEGFWSPMETVRDKKALEIYWKNNQAPWKVWAGDKQVNTI